MSRSGYMSASEYDFNDDVDWVLSHGRYLGRLASATRGKRGQALLREMEAALLALPEKRLCADVAVSPRNGEVCAFGAVALKRKLEVGKTYRAKALAEITAQFPASNDAPAFAAAFDVAEPLAAEIVHQNDDVMVKATAEERYQHVLAWVQEKIKR